MIALLAAQEGNDSGRWILFLLFFVLPLGLRLLRKLAERFGLVQPEEPEAEGGTPAQRALRMARERQRLEREARRRSEEEGGAQWRRLARGEESARKAEPAPGATPAPLPMAERASALSLETEVEPEPLAMIGSVLEPSEVRATSLESEEEPQPLAALQATQAPGWRRRSSWRLRPGEVRRAVVLAEVLGPPLSERPLPIGRP